MVPIVPGQARVMMMRGRRMQEVLEVEELEEREIERAIEWHLGPILGPSWALLGLLSTLSGPYGAILGPSWAILGPLWTLLGLS